MTLETRLRELCEAGDRTHAASLAKAVLSNEPIEAVVPEDDHVRIETPRFRGVHELVPDGQGGVRVRPAGEYTFTSERVELTVSTRVVPAQAVDRVAAALAELHADTAPDGDRDGPEAATAVDAAGEPVDDAAADTTADAAVDAAVDAEAADPPARSRMDVLKGYF